jgi:iron complex transport system substrate-binding protein
VSLPGRRPLTLVLFAILAACNGSPADTGSPDEGRDESIRVVTLSPHLAEIAYAVGAGDSLVGVSAYTDFPSAAASVPVVGDAYNLDQERLALLEPDLLLAWDTGTPLHVIDALRSRGYRVEVITTTHLDDVPSALIAVGTLLGTPKQAAGAAAEFRRAFAELSGRYRDAPPISVFYQVDSRPLYTINGSHFVSELIGVCGGTNIFASLDGLAPLVSVEAVLESDPEVILASSDAGAAAFNEWERWPELAANRYGNRYLIPADQIGRPTPRLQSAAVAVCDALDQARSNREAARTSN